MIVGFSLQDLEAHTYSPKRGDMNINYSHKITDVAEADVPAIDDDVARVHFTFNITYQKDGEDVADIAFDGTLLWQKDSEAVIEHWEENEALPEDVTPVVANYIFRKGLTQAVYLADTLDLPSPVPMPTIRGKQQ